MWYTYNVPYTTGWPFWTLFLDLLFNHSLMNTKKFQQNYILCINSLLDKINDTHFTNWEYVARHICYKRLFRVFVKIYCGWELWILIFSHCAKTQTLPQNIIVSISKICSSAWSLPSLTRSAESSAFVWKSLSACSISSSSVQRRPLLKRSLRGRRFSSLWWRSGFYCRPRILFCRRAYGTMVTSSKGWYSLLRTGIGV